MKRNLLSLVLGVILGIICTTFVSQIGPEIQSALAFSDKSPEQFSPYDWVKQDQIHLYKEYVKIDLKNARIASFADTNSMDPLLDEDSNGIEILPESIEDIHIGDVISYKYENDNIIHRVIEMGYDSEGWYAVLKGDNNLAQDPEKVRFKQIRYILVGVIY